jgi:serine phosphatase RsbU (regulator of sigma subunit)
MDYLEVIDAQGRRQRIDLDRPHLLIGRESTCDIHLPNPAVSRRHAQLQSLAPGRWLLQDLNSRNHVYVNNQPVQQTVLEPGKRARIAEYRLVLQTAAPTAAPEPPEAASEDTTGDYSWASLDPDWLAKLQAVQMALLRLEDPRRVLERLAEEMGAVVRPQLLAVGLATTSRYHWEVVRYNAPGPPPAPPLAEAEQRAAEGGSSVQAWEQPTAVGACPVGGPSHCLLFPMKGRSGVIGHVFVQGPAAAPLPPTVHRFLALLATFAGLVWDNLHLATLRLAQKEIEHELNQARQIQVGLFPATFDVDPRLDVYGVNLPTAQVSGDHFDVVRLGPDTIAFVIADAMGHGMPAALLMAAVRAALGMGLTLGLPWQALFNGIDDLIAQSRANAFASGIIGEIDLRERQLRLVSAGHPLPSVLVEGHLVPIPQECQTRPWGLVFEAPWEVGRLSLAGAHWSILCCTDGVVDAAVRANREADDWSIDTYHQRHQQLGAEDLCQHLLNEVAGPRSSLTLPDDQTVLVLRSA